MEGEFLYPGNKQKRGALGAFSHIGAPKRWGRSAAADRCQQATEGWEMKFLCVLPAKLALSARGCAQPQETGTSQLAMGMGSQNS